jgi:hypothetical protein
LLDKRCNRRGDPLPAAGHNGALYLLQATRGESGARKEGKAVFVLGLGHAADDIAAAEVLQVVGKRVERRDDVVDIGDVLLPLGLFVLPARQLVEVDGMGHVTTTFLPVPIRCMAMPSTETRGSVVTASSTSSSLRRRQLLLL